MQNLKTPGVYVQEISKLPASVAPVATAIPAFIGYTEKSKRGKEEIPVNTPVKISSLLDYEEIFGMPYEESYSITLTGESTDEEDTSIELSPAGGDLSPYLLYYNLRMFFANGGGSCYVVSVGTYDENPTSSSIDFDELDAGVDVLEEEDEPTLLVVPEAVNLDEGDRGQLYNNMRSQCAKLQDRFSIADVVQKGGTTIDDADDFRDSINMENLKYGAAYYPALDTTIRRFYKEESVQITDERGEDDIGPYQFLNLKEISEGSEHVQGIIEIVSNADLTANSDDVEITIGDHTFVLREPDTDENETQFELKATEITTAGDLAEKINTVGEDENFKAQKISGDSVIIVKSTEPGAEVDIPISYQGPAGAVLVPESENLELVAADKTLYNKIKKELDKERLQLYPSSAMAGVYARVDRNRGVWKAPANVSLNLVDEPSLLLTDDQQAPLNVDANTGKSVNVIRKFHQKGTIVWGARTLAGNDNEWRYVPVRRLFIFIEESIQKATEPVVFEPNNANTWSKTKAMIENFLSDLWRDGALAGATPEDAFFVKVGLGETMNANDILEGRLIIEIGIAAVRPAEFIVLQFMHKLQES